MEYMSKAKFEQAEKIDKFDKWGGGGGMKAYQ